MKSLFEEHTAEIFNLLIGDESEMKRGIAIYFNRGEQEFRKMFDMRDSTHRSLFIDMVCEMEGWGSL